MIPDLAASPGTGNMALAVVTALLLGVRHATEPDHLTAISTLVLADRDGPAGRGGGLARTGLLGLAWGSGHAVTLLAIGLPVLFAGRLLPDAVQRAAETLVGLLIVALAVRLLVRWRRGYFHLHVHSHGGVAHAHPHFHERTARDGHPRSHRHDHAYVRTLGRSPWLSFGLGAVHGVGGSAAATVLLMAAWADPVRAGMGLVAFAAATAAAMATVSAAFGLLLARRGAARRLERWIPAVAVASLLFGAAYAWTSLGLFGR